MKYITLYIGVWPLFKSRASSTKSFARSIYLNFSQTSFSTIEKRVSTHTANASLMNKEWFVIHSRDDWQAYIPLNQCISLDTSLLRPEKHGSSKLYRSCIVNRSMQSFHWNCAICRPREEGNNQFHSLEKKKKRKEKPILGKIKIVEIARRTSS